MFVLVPPTIISAQIWVVRYNGPYNGLDEAYAIAVDGAGNVYVTGESYGSDTTLDYATVKYDASGVEQWVVRYNGPANGVDRANAIAIDNTGNIYVTGGSFDFSYDYATVKYDSLGVEQWVARYDGTGNGFDLATAIAIDNTGNIYVTGGSHGSGTGENYATVKYDASGVEQWVARYHGPGNPQDMACAIAIDDAGAIYVTGSSHGSGTNFDYATVKYDSLGVEQWVARYHGPGSNSSDYAVAIAIDNTDNIYVTGRSSGDYATVKYDASGVEQWVARYNTPYGGGDYAAAIAIDNTGNIYVTGESYGLGSDLDYATVKYDSAGNEQWVARYNGFANSMDGATAIAVNEADAVYVTGVSFGSGTDYDYATVKYDSAGNEQWVKRYNGPANGEDGATAIAVNEADAVYVTGVSFGSGTDYDYATVKYSSTGIREDMVTRVKNNYFSATIFSGPLLLPKDKKCKVFDITGRIVEPTRITRGIYFIEIDGQITQKVVKVR
jgi:hypothetical protein